MKTQTLILLIVAHWLAGLGGFVWVQGAALAAADAGQVPAALGPAALAVHYVLLQPFAYWLLSSTPLVWWTWPGLVGLASVLLCNSLLVGAIVAGVDRALVRRRRSR